VIHLRPSRPASSLQNAMHCLVKGRLPIAKCNAKPLQTQVISPEKAIKILEISATHL
jgi:hypothetical protein